MIESLNGVEGLFETDCVEKVGVLRRSSKSAEHPPAKAPSLKHSLPKGDMRERCSKILRRFSGCRVFQQNQPRLMDAAGRANDRSEEAAVSNDATNCDNGHRTN
ncbi:hypothetical protein [Roseovarius pacificus]|uniref:hypothetical protein n=1 Tax=Roseovarius pacificus TaxID=337701 RepID=UPI001160210B|nr:hypothetical protein [Roseovarius pacificus]